LKELQEGNMKYREVIKKFKENFQKVIELFEEQHNEKGLYAVLQRLTEKLEEGPAERAYLSIKELDVSNRGVEFLANLNVLERSPRDAHMIRLCDPRSPLSDTL